MHPGWHKCWKTFPHITKPTTLAMTAWPLEWGTNVFVFFAIPRCSSFNSHYKGCVRAYRLAACNAVHFTFTAGGWGKCGMLMVWHSVFLLRLIGAALLCLMGYHAMSSAYSQWPENVPSTTTTVPQEVEGNWRALKDAGVCKWGWPLIQLCWLLL